MKSEYVDQHTLFVNSLYNELKKEDEKIKLEYNKFASKANDYITAGLSEGEVVELLIVDGLDRDAAEGYVSMAQDMGTVESEQEYSFIFEDEGGNLFTSFDINQTIVADSNEEAMTKASLLIGDTDNNYGITKIISINKA